MAAMLQNQIIHACIYIGEPIEHWLAALHNQERPRYLLIIRQVICMNGAVVRLLI